jgi:hypothetical protein
MADLAICSENYILALLKAEKIDLALSMLQ